ncbi:hypothetical protein AAVH_41458 [Aphelenchoides avenae]|nr:hypothetical protein AAVH_41458 [Aphelenchus avenae]
MSAHLWKVSAAAAICVGRSVPGQGDRLPQSRWIMPESDLPALLGLHPVDAEHANDANHSHYTDHSNNSNDAHNANYPYDTYHSNHTYYTYNSHYDYKGRRPIRT